jgi:hypothetical protein
LRDFLQTPDWDEIEKRLRKREKLADAVRDKGRMSGEPLVRFEPKRLAQALSHPTAGT